MSIPCQSHTSLTKTVNVNRAQSYFNVFKILGVVCKLCNIGNHIDFIGFYM